MRAVDAGRARRDRNAARPDARSAGEARHVDAEGGPSGDYAFELFAKAGKLRPGADQALSAKALKLTGGPDSPPPPPDRSVYGVLVAGGQADVFLTYCTNAIVAQREHPSLVVTAVPPALAVGADYGITVISGAPDAARRFAAFVLSPEGRRIIERHGFALP